MSTGREVKQAPPLADFQYEKIKDFYTGAVVSAPVNQVQGLYVKDRNSFVEQRFDANSAISAMFTAETTIIQKLNMGVCQTLQRLLIRLNVTSSGATAQFAPTPFWFKRIEIYNAQQSKLQVIHPEEILFKLNQIAERNDREALKEICHFGDRGLSWNSPTAAQQMASGETRDFWLPIMSVLDMANLNFRYVKDWIEFRFVTRGDIVESGSGVPAVNSIHFVIQERNLSADTDLLYRSQIWNDLKRYNYLDCYRFSEVSRTALTTGTEYSVNLSSIPPCFSPFMLIAMRQSSTIDENASGLTLSSYVPIGPAGKVQLRYGNNNIMEISGGVNVDLLYRTLSQKYLKGDLLRQFPLYLMSFADSVDGPLAGRFINGYYRFDGNSNQQLVIQPVSGTSCVQTITAANNPAPDGGFWRLGYKECFTDSLAHNASPATIKAALEALPSFKRENLTVTVTQEFSTAGTLTLTFPARCGNVDSLVTMISESVNDGGVAAQSQTTLTTRGVPGIVSGQTHVIDIFVFYYKELHTRNGVLVDKKVYDA